MNPLGDGSDGSKVGPNYLPGAGSGTTTWNFSSSADYDFDAAQISVSGNKAALKQVDTTHNSAADFSGTHLGTAYSSGALQLSATTNSLEHTTNWSPKHSNIVGYWKLNEASISHGSAIAATIGPNGTVTTNNGATEKAVTARLGNGMYFDGIDDEVSLGATLDSSTQTKLTLSAWVKSDAGAVNDGIMGWWDGTNGIYVQSNSVGEGIQVLAGSAADFGSVAFETSDAWIHVALVYDGSLVGNANRLQLYLNGQPRTLVFNGGAAIPAAIPALTNTTLKIGAINALGQYWQGSIDEAAIWQEALSASELAQIYEFQKSKYAGLYISPIIALGQSLSWTTLSASSSFPFLKELPAAANSEAVADYSSVSANLMANLVGLWHLNETAAGSAPGGTDFQDSSGNGFHGTRGGGGLSFGVSGTLGKAANFSGGFVALDDSFTMIPAGSTGATISAWVTPTSMSADRRIFSLVRNNTAASSLSILAGRAAGKFSAFFRNNVGGLVQVDSASSYVPGQTYHVAATIENGMGILYVNGAAVGSSNLAHLAQTLTFDNTITAKIGSEPSGGATFFHGTIDEAALWSRPLSAAEIAQVYRRGGNRIKYQVRSCDDAACSGESWLGATGSAYTYLSELHNNTAINNSGDGSGTVKAGSLALTFTDFLAAGLTIANNSYFQYRVIMESDDENSLCAGQACKPELSSLEIGPIGRYYGGGATISNRIPATYSQLSTLVISAGGACSPTYQLSKNGTDYFYWDGSVWAAATAGLAHSGSAAVTTSHVTDFSSLVGPGSFYFKAFLTSDTTQDCELNSVLLNFSQ